MCCRSSVCFLLCISFFTCAASERKGCNTTVEILPPNATASPGAEPDEALRITCFTPLSTSKLLSLTTGFLIPQPEAKETGGDETMSTNVQNNDDDVSTTTNARPKSAQASKWDEMENGKNGMSGSIVVSDGSIAGSTSSGDVVKTFIAQLLVPHESFGSGHDGSDSLLSHVVLSPAFHSENTSASIKFSGSRLGLVVLFKEASLSCSSVSTYPLYCMAVSCHTINNATCLGRLEETVVYDPLFVRGCERDPSPSYEGFPNRKCFQSRNFTRSDVEKDANAKEKTLPVDGSDNSKERQGIHGIHYPNAGHRTFPKKNKLRRGKDIIDETDHSKERLSSYMILSTSFAGGFVIGSSVAGICWCLRLSDPD